MRKLLLTVFFCVAIGNLLFGAKLKDPELAIPYIKKAPVIDGKLEPGEWKYAAAVTMFGLYNKPDKPMYREQPVFYVAWDEKHLYVAMNSIESNTNTVVAKCSRHDVVRIIGDDCMEFMLSPGDLNAQVDKDFPTYYFAVNSLGTIWDALFKPLRAECHNSWESDAEVVSSVDGTRWICEMKIPFSTIRGDAPKDGTLWRMNFDRTYYGYKWIAWNPMGGLNDARIGGNVVFRKNSPVVRLLSVNDIINGHMKLDVEAANDTGKETEVDIEVTCTGRNSIKDEGKIICRDTLKLKIKPGEVKEVTLGKGQKLLWYNFIVVKAVDRKGKELFYLERNVNMPVRQFKKLPAPEQALVYIFPRYLPSRKRLAVEMDCTAWIKKNKATGTKFAATVNVFNEKDKSKSLFKGDFNDFKDGKGVWRHSTEKLPEGNYIVQVTVTADGNEIVKFEDWFEKRIFPWMKNRIEIGDKAPAPYTPLKVEGNSVSPWNRTYTFTENGLPAKMVSRKKELLKAPVTISLKENGENVSLKTKSPFKFTKKTDGNVEGAAVLEGKNIKINIDSRTEYDGLTFFRLTYAPVKGKASVDKMRIKIPLNAKYIRFFSASGDKNGVNILGKPFPQKDGKVYDSSKDTRSVVCSPTFSTLYWTGDYDTCFCYAADNDKGWSIRDDAPAVEADKEGDTVNLYLNLIDKKTQVNKPQTLEFALQTGPTKPLPKNWRGIQNGGDIDSAPMTRFGLQNMGSGFTLHGGPYIVHPGLTPEMIEKSKKRVEAAIHGDNRLKPMAYCRWGGIPKGLPETRVFRGEWGIDKATWNAAKAITAKFMWPRKFFGDNKDMYILMLIPPRNSYVDTLSNAYNETLKHTQLYGFYDDTGYPKAVFDLELDRGFIRPDGKEIYSSGLWTYRKRWKEASYINSIHNRLDMNGDSQHVHAHFMPAYGFIGCWAPCEKGFYNPFKEIDNYDFYESLERYAAINPAKQFGQVPMVGMSSSKWEEFGTDKDARSMMMLALLHDQDVGSFGHRNLRTICRLRAARNVFRQWDDDVKFIGYWESSDSVRATPESIKISLYTKKNGALFMIGNIAKKTVKAEITPDWKKLGINPDNIKVINSETLEGIPLKDGKFSISIPSHDLALVLAGNLKDFKLPSKESWNQLPKPGKLLAKYSDDFKGPELDPKWEKVLHQGTSSVGILYNKLFIQGHNYGYAMIKEKLDGIDNFSAQCTILRGSHYAYGRKGSLYIFWKSGSYLEAGIFKGKFQFSVNGRNYRGPEINTKSPYGWYPYLENAVKIKLTPENIEFYSSSDGKTWSKPVTIKRNDKFKGAPEYLILGNGLQGKNPYLQNVHEKHFKPDRGAKTTFFSDLMVGTD